jgi:hypothetical protein
MRKLVGAIAIAVALALIVGCGDAGPGAPTVDTSNVKPIAPKVGTRGAAGAMPEHQQAPPPPLQLHLGGDDVRLEREVIGEPPKKIL